MAAPILDVGEQRTTSFAATQCAEIRHRPIQPGQFQQVFDEAHSLPQGQTEQSFDHEAGLDRRIIIRLLTARSA